MKKLLILLFSILILPSSVNASDVYYCSDDDNTGYDVSENLEHAMFGLGKFKIMLDFDNKNVISEEKSFTSDFNQSCYYNFNDDTLYCFNDVGSAFSINKFTLRYFYADLYNKRILNNDPRLAYGTCEKF